jgi:hypothetical protein
MARDDRPVIGDKTRVLKIAGLVKRLVTAIVREIRVRAYTKTSGWQ